ncbi:MAG: sigma-70 family RNA polymerase sigma factor [Lachnospiraceae bacterium]|nr:sigma-70 family RNA polymerase sigma factor [Lachnospiraceae bacterium]
MSRKGGSKIVEDEKIVELYLSRSEEAIAQTAQKYGSRLRNIAYNILNDRETAEECENDAYHETWNLIPPNEPRNYLFAFVGRIVRHIALNICKMSRRQKRYAVYCELTQEMQECIPADNDIEAEIEAEYLSSLIDAFLEIYTEEQQNVFVRRYWYFDSVAEIAKTFGYTQGKVKSMLFRMRADLKKRLEKEGYDI